MNHENILKCLAEIVSDPEKQKVYFSNPLKFLQESGLSPEEQQACFQFASPVAKFHNFQYQMLEDSRKQQIEIAEVNSSFRKSMINTNNNIISGFNSTMTMYKVSFYLGVALLIVAVVFAFVSKSSLFAILFGSIGTIDILTFFITKPPQSLQKSRAEQAKLNAVYYSWFLDLYNWNAYYLQFQTPQGELIKFETVKGVSEKQVENTEKLMKIISEQQQNL